MRFHQNSSCRLLDENRQQPPKQQPIINDDKQTTETSEWNRIGKKFVQFSLTFYYRYFHNSSYRSFESSLMKLIIIINLILLTLFCSQISALSSSSLPNFHHLKINVRKSIEFFNLKGKDYGKIL